MNIKSCENYISLNKQSLEMKQQDKEEQDITEESHILFDPFRREDIYGDCGQKKLTFFQSFRLILFAIIFIPIRVLLVLILIFLCYTICKIFSWIPIGNIKYLYINYICTTLSKICLFVIGFYYIQWSHFTSKNSSNLNFKLNYKILNRK